MYTQVMEIALEEVCKEFGLSRDQIVKGGREQRVAEPRHIFCYIALHCGYKAPEIANHLNRDRTTILNGLRRHKALYETDELFRSITNKIYDRVKDRIIKIK